MSTFRVPVVEVRALEPIPKADLIELAVLGDYRSVVGRGSYTPGQLVGYIPEGSVVPEAVMRRVGVWNEVEGHGKLTGPDFNILRAAKMRGCLSQGLVYPLEPIAGERDRALLDGVVVSRGDDLMERLGITKYEPPIPAEMAGNLVALFGVLPKFDVEARKAYPDVLRDGELVEMTEKVHGISCIISAMPGLAHEKLFWGGDITVSSKLLAQQHLLFQDDPENDGNVYVEMLKALEPQVRALHALAEARGEPLHVVGEIVGTQDLKYGLKNGQKAYLGLRVYAGERTLGRWLDVAERREILDAVGFTGAPVLYEGPYSREAVLAHRDGKTVYGKGVHIREGVVVVPMKERYDDGVGSVILKEVSEAYLTRKGGTEYS